jgi:hypothetical protein
MWLYVKGDFPGRMIDKGTMKEKWGWCFTGGMPLFAYNAMLC